MTSASRAMDTVRLPTLTARRNATWVVTANESAPTGTVTSRRATARQSQSEVSMKVITLGTGSPLPDPNRAGPATLVRAGGRDLLFDCGRGVLMRAAAAGTGPIGFDTVLLTHLHSDHV